MEIIADDQKTKKRKLSALEEQNKPQDTVNTGDLARLCLNAGFLWDVNPSMLLGDDEEADSDSSGENTKVDGNKKKNKLTRAERREKALREEEKTRSAELKLMNSEGPQTADDFDRLVLSSPNSSVCWIKYMAFHLQAAEIEKARAVARRAITTISFREETEKLNVWCSLLSLENLYGTKESLEKTLEEAVTMNDPFKVYTHMLKLYSESSKTQEAEKLVTHLTKKFHEDKEAWLQGGEALLKLGKTEKSRMLMQKALNNLEKKFHVEVISRFARLENKLGDPERAQTLMEFILTSYPKRTDMWNSYVDMLVKNGQHDAARQVLERAIAQKLPVRNMKSLFSKYLQFEEQHGTPEGVEKIRQKAIDYVEASGGTTIEKES
ncbi:Protein RRP5 [Blattella germanica]|nr:Protein RRP5 [Blattella germanica]